MITFPHRNARMIWEMYTEASALIADSLADSIIAYTKSNNPSVLAAMSEAYPPSGVGKTKSAVILLGEYITALVANQAEAMHLVTKECEKLLVAMYAWHEWWTTYLDRMYDPRYAKSHSQDVPDFIPVCAQLADLMLKYGAAGLP